MDNDTSMYLNQVEEFIQWCADNFLNLNVSKTKEMVFDFRKDRNVHEALVIKDESVVFTKSYKYLGVYIDDRLDFTENIHSLYKKCLQRVRHLRELANIRVDIEILSLFYNSIIESVLAYSIVSWYGSSNKKDKNKLSKIIRIGKKMGICTQSLNNIFNDHCIKTVIKILKDPEHPLYDQYVFLRSGRRLMVPKQRTNRFGDTFVPSSIKLYNFHLSTGKAM